MAEQIHTTPTGQYIPDDVRHALIGAAFDVQDRIRTGVPRLLSMSDEVITSVTRPVDNLLKRLPIVGALNKSIGQQVDGRSGAEKNACSAGSRSGSGKKRAVACWPIRRPIR